jgi:hypothetical protein
VIDTVSEGMRYLGTSFTRRRKLEEVVEVPNAAGGADIADGGVVARRSFQRITGIEGSPPAFGGVCGIRSPRQACPGVCSSMIGEKRGGVARGCGDDGVGAWTVFHRSDRVGVTGIA